jgi:SAM-dependent methyltransferase
LGPRRDGPRNRPLRADLDFKSLDALEISGDKWAAFGFASYRSVKLREYDWCGITLTETFDVVIAEQVLEHVTHPRSALQNAHAMLRPSGVLILTLPFLIRIHNYPVDCTRWTPLGLEYLLDECGFSNVGTDALGNRSCIRGNFGRWARYVPWRHSLKNEPNFPVVVWAFARP